MSELDGLLSVDLCLCRLSVGKMQTYGDPGADMNVPIGNFWHEVWDIFLPKTSHGYRVSLGFQKYLVTLGNPILL